MRWSITPGPTVPLIPYTSVRCLRPCVTASPGVKETRYSGERMVRVSRLHIQVLPFWKRVKLSGRSSLSVTLHLRRLALEELNRYRDHLEDLVRERTTELAMANEQLSREIEERKRAERGAAGKRTKVPGDL